MTPEARAARERKQKIFVVVGGLLLLALLAFQLPKLLGGSSSSEAAAPADTTSLPGQTAPAPTGTTPAVVVDARRTAVAASGKLTSFSVFEAKDPFVQQVVTPTTSGSGDGGGSDGAKDAKAGGGSKGFSTEPSAPTETVITVNGARQAVEQGMKFPADDPLFVLVAEKPQSKSALIGIAGGAYESGGKTTTLKVGKPVTLVNTTTGARYKITLVSVASGEPAAPPAAKQ